MLGEQSDENDSVFGYSISGIFSPLKDVVVISSEDFITKIISLYQNRIEKVKLEEKFIYAAEDR